MANKNNFKGKVFSAASSIFKSKDRRLAILKANRAHTDAMNALFSDAINIFVKTAVRSMLVDTAMSVSSFTALASSLGVNPQKLGGLVKVKEQGSGLDAIKEAHGRIKEGSRKGYTNISGDWIPNGIRSSSTGNALGADAYTIDYADASKGIISFKFEAVVWQHAALMPDSLVKGRNAMKTYIDTNFGEYVDPLKFLKLVLNI